MPASKAIKNGSQESRTRATSTDTVMSSFKTSSTAATAGTMMSQLRIRLRSTIVAAAQVSAEAMPTRGVK